MKLRYLLAMTPLVFSVSALAAPAAAPKTVPETALTQAAQTNPVAMMQGLTDALLSKLKADQSQLKQNPNHLYDIVNQILVPYLDTQGMARSVLGRTAWTKATPAEQQAFTSALLSVVIRTYSSALNAYTDQAVTYLPIRGGVGDKTLVTVNSQIKRSDGPPVGVSYRLAKVGNQWKVYDMNVEGVSLLQSFRSQIQAQLSQGMTVAQLTQKLEQHEKSNANSAAS